MGKIAFFLIVIYFGHHNHRPWLQKAYIRSRSRPPVIYIYIYIYNREFTWGSGEKFFIIVIVSTAVI